MSKSATIAVSIIFCCIFTVYVTGADESKGLSGKITYEDFSPAAGTVIYTLDKRHRLTIDNNIIMVAENIPRAITDLNGNFQLKNPATSNTLLFIKDMEDNSVLVIPDAADSSEIVMPKSATIKGQLLKGVLPVKGQKITAYYLSPGCALRYTHTTKTNAKGQFRFRSLMPGDYRVQVAHDVPQVGCSFRSVITRQADVIAMPGSKNEIKLGGTDLPFLKGKITDTEGNGLHGVWVRLERSNKTEPRNKQSCNENSAWSEVTEKDGSYQIFDIPPGQYKLHCFRRLALNNYSRTLQAEKTITIKDNAPKNRSANVRAENICDVAIDLQPFMPLEYGQQSPQLTGTLLTGENFDLAEYKSKIVILHFYASWCLPCVSSIAEFDELAEAFDPEKVIVLGISLDDTIDDCRQFISQRNIQHLQLFAGPWTDSKIRNDFRVSNVPTDFIIDTDGRIAQMDLFGRVLKKIVKKLLQN